MRWFGLEAGKEGDSRTHRRSERTRAYPVFRSRPVPFCAASGVALSAAAFGILVMALSRRRCLECDP